MTETVERAEYEARHRVDEPEQVGAFGVKVGDIFYRSWGYDQTNVNYYVVVELTKTGKSVRLREIGATHTDDPHGPVTHVVPDVERFVDAGQGWCTKCRQRTRVVGEHGSYGGEPAGTLVHTATDRAYCITEDGYEIPGQVATAPPPTIYLKRIQQGYRNDGEPVLSFDSYSNLYRWDGSPQYQTGFGWGH